MYVSSLELKQFRSYSDARFEFSPNINVILGPNGSGKTTLLEAIYVIGQGKSFRDKDEQLAMHNKDWWVARAMVGEDVREIRYSEGQKKIINQSSLPKRFMRTDSLPMVLFEPNDLQLVSGSPRARRDYVDFVVAIDNPQHVTNLKKYERILIQRNRLLKLRNFNKDEMFVWDIVLSEMAEKVITARLLTISKWDKVLGNLYNRVAKKTDKINVSYESKTHSDNYKNRILLQLKKTLDHDILTGNTSHGPHRDDIQFLINDHSLSSTGSRGETRNIIIALKVYETQVLRDVYDTEPILLLDDVLSELDEDRQNNLLLNQTSQTIITATHLSGKLKSYKTANVISLDN